MGDKWRLKARARTGLWQAAPGATLDWLMRAGKPHLAYSLLAVLLLAFAGMAWHTYESVKREMTEAALARRSSVSHLAAATLSERLDRVVDLAVSLATRVRFADLVAAGQWEEAIEILRRVPLQFEYIDRLFLSDVHGTLMADVPALPDVRGRSFARRDWYQGISRGWKPYVSTVYKRTAMPQRNVIAVAAPIRDPTTERIAGILVLQVSLEAFFGWAQAIDLGKGGALFVVDASGQAAYHSGAAAQGPIANLSANPAVRRLLEGKSGVEIALEDAGRDAHLYAFVPAGHGWGVAMQQPASEAFAARDAQLERLLVGYGLILLLLIAAVLLSTQLVAQYRRALDDRNMVAELERRVAEHTAAIEASNQELESFSYSVSHDLRAPLRAIDGYSRMVEEDYGGRIDAEGRRLLGVVRSSSREMGQLIDDLLAFSRVSRTAPVVSRIDMTGLAKEVVDGLAGGSRAAVELGALPAAAGDRALLKQVWTNLVSNALKYSGQRQQPVVQIGGKTEGRELVYWVRDNGVGFDMRYAEKLFGVFQRLHRADEFPGTGVGLAIVQRVVARHGGRVWAEGRIGEGACFYFSLPMES